MSQYRTASRELARALGAGRHELSNHDLRQIYAIGRVTVKARDEIALELERAGLEVLSDPAQEPLTVRKPAIAHAAPALVSRPRARLAAIVAAVVLVLVFIAATSEGDHSRAKDAPRPTPRSPKPSSPRRRRRPSLKRARTPRMSSMPATTARRS